MSQRHLSPAGPRAGAGGGTAAAASSLRPRARRLISIEGVSDDEPNIDASGQSLSTSNSLRDAVDAAFSGPRRHSPAPSAHPSRGTSLTRRSPQQRSRAASRTFGLEIPTTGGSGSKSYGKGSSLWASSWTSLQGVASTLLGNNAEPTTPLTPGGGKAGKRGKHGRNYSVSVPDEPWGPLGKVEDMLAVGSQEERLAKVQAEKRKRLLVGTGGVGDEFLQRDALGRYKRRSSLDKDDPIPSPTQDDDALVYIHRVAQGDSVAGLSIRYNCSQATVRKSNRLYPNDSIQLRKVAYLPVDACSVRGKKVPPPGSSNLELAVGFEDVTRNNGKKADSENADYHISSPSNHSPHPSSQSSEKEPQEEPWTHDSWVILPHTATPVEIGRLPRRTLGFFPPARRKSITAAYSDTSPADSITSDQAPANATPALTASARTSPGRGISPGQRPSTRLSRSSSTASKLSPHARFTAGFLRGPGGIGSLHSSIHGPPPDELNRFVAVHMPQLIIEGAEGGVGRLDGLNSHGGGLPPRAGLPSTGLGLAGPRLSFDRISVASGGSAGTGVEAVAGAVEGWMRKVGGRVKGSLGTPEMRGRGGGTIAGRDGDLIELVGSWDLNGEAGQPGTGGADSWESEGHGVLDETEGSILGSPAASVNGKKKKIKAAAVTAAAASAREEDERLLRERFPPAGRVFEDQGRKAV